MDIPTEEDDPTDKPFADMGFDGFVGLCSLEADHDELSDFFLNCHFGYHCVNFRIGEGKGLGIDYADKECDEKA